MLQDTGNGKTALESILDALGKRGVMFLLGSGAAALERSIQEIARRYTRT